MNGILISGGQRGGVRGEIEGGKGVEREDEVIADEEEKVVSSEEGRRVKLT